MELSALERAVLELLLAGNHPALPFLQTRCPDEVSDTLPGL
jgi:hypothetical protein